MSHKPKNSCNEQMCSITFSFLSINEIIGWLCQFYTAQGSFIFRAQEEAGKDISDVDIDILKTPRMRFGIIGAGSANSIVSSVHGTDDCPTAAIHIAIGIFVKHFCFYKGVTS